MKKIFTIILLFVLTLSSSFATTGLKTTLNSDDLLAAEIFYINWEWFTKDEWKLVKVENIKFYSIAWQKYIKKNWVIKKIEETKIRKINNINYVVDNNKLVTLENFLKNNEVEDEEEKSEPGTFSDIYKDDISETQNTSESEDVTEDIFEFMFTKDDENADNEVVSEENEEPEMTEKEADDFILDLFWDL